MCSAREQECILRRTAQCACLNFVCVEADMTCQLLVHGSKYRFANRTFIAKQGGACLALGGKQGRNRLWTRAMP